MIIISKEKVQSIKWEDHQNDFDYQLYLLGKDANETHFYVVNPGYDETFAHIIDKTIESRGCLVYTWKKDWVVKRFPIRWDGKSWSNTEIPEHIMEGQSIWTVNPDIDPFIVFNDDPYRKYTIPDYDRKYDHVWYIDPKHCPNGEKIWLYKLKTSLSQGQEKDMGCLTPRTSLIVNPELGDVQFEEPAIPFYDAVYNNVFHLDKKHEAWDNMWAFTIAPYGFESQGEKFLGPTTPKFEITYNPDLDFKPEISYHAPWYDFKYVHVWYLNPKQANGEKIWIATMKYDPNAQEEKDMGYIDMPFDNLDIEYNTDIPNVNYKLDNISIFDIQYTTTYYLHPQFAGKQKIWAVKIKPKNSLGEKDLGFIRPVFPELKVTKNPDLPDFKFKKPNITVWQNADDSKSISVYDFDYEHVWYVDSKESKGQKIWAVKVTIDDPQGGVKDMGEISVIKKPISIEYNPDLPDFQFDVPELTDVFSKDYVYEHVWYVSTEQVLDEKVWAVKVKYVKDVQGLKDMGEISVIKKPLSIELNKELPTFEFVVPDIKDVFSKDFIYEHVWYVDLDQTNGEKIWAAKVRYAEEVEGVKEMGFMPIQINPLRMTYNKDLPHFEFEIPKLENAFGKDWEYRMIWFVDSSQTADEKVWAVQVDYIDEPLGIKDMGEISVPLPKINYTFNQALPKFNFTEPTVNIFDSGYELIWYVDTTLTQGNKIWAVKATPEGEFKGTKEMGTVDLDLPELEIEYNPSLPELNFEMVDLPLFDLQYEHVWYVNPIHVKGEEKIWAVKVRAAKEIVGSKDMGYIDPKIDRQLDVIFICYKESNAEENWNRVLAKAPYAKKVSGVKGIFEAHKAAARMAKTDMFYVVDGDAWLADDWNFENEIGIFDRDCVHVFNSVNPVNGLVYGFGGVKVFPRKTLLETNTWKTDMTTSVTKKLKVVDVISNLTVFNTDEFSAWRSAFRECAKLAAGVIDNQVTEETQHRLETWMSNGADKSFGKEAIAGARLGAEYGRQGKSLEKINDRDWLYQQFINWKKGVPMAKDVLCPVPWMHLNFEPNGKVVPCCLTSTHNYFAGDLQTQTIHEIWNSDNMKKLRKQMINGEEPEICSKCFNRERVTGESGRIYHIRSYPEVMKAIPDITEPDGTCKTMELKYWDFRFSNLCNFKCRSCGPRYSSAWVPDAKKIGMISEQEKVWYIDNVDDKTNFDFLADQVQYVERIYFAGGEPLLMDEHWLILQMLVDAKRYDVRLSYNTNCSVLTYGKKNVLDYWKNWDYGKLEIWPSIDEFGERAELIRAGTVWPKVEQNLKDLIKLDNAIIRPGITVGAMNVFRIPELVMYLNELGVLQEKHHYHNFFINLLEDPKHYHVHILPDEYKKEIVQKLEDFIEWYNGKFNTNMGFLFQYIIHELKKPHNPESAQRFLRVSAQVDGVRNECIFDTIPELNCLREMYPGIYEKKVYE